MPAYELLLNGASIPFYECVVEKQEKRALDKCLFKVKRSQSVSLAADVKFRKSGATPVYLFGGKVVEVNEEYDGKTCTAFSYAKTLDEQRVFPSKLYTSKSPEFIARDLIASYTSLTWASSWSSGVTLNVYEAVGTVGENIRRLAQMAGADYWTFVDTFNSLSRDHWVVGCNLVCYVDGLLAFNSLSRDHGSPRCWEDLAKHIKLSIPSLGIT